MLQILKYQALMLSCLDQAKLSKHGKIRDILFLKGYFWLYTLVFWHNIQAYIFFLNESILVLHLHLLYNYILLLTSSLNICGLFAVIISSQKQICKNYAQCKHTLCCKEASTCRKIFWQKLRMRLWIMKWPFKTNACSIKLILTKWHVLQWNFLHSPIILSYMQLVSIPKIKDFHVLKVITGNWNLEF